MACSRRGAFLRRPDGSPPRRRIGRLILGTVALLLVLGLVAAAEWGLTATPGSSVPHMTDLMPDTITWANTTATDLHAEADYSATYLYRWQTYDGCAVRLDYVMTRRGGCIAGVDEVLTGWPFGSTHDHHDYRVFVRDPSGASASKNAKGFDAHASLPQCGGHGTPSGWLCPLDDPRRVWIHLDRCERGNRTVAARACADRLRLSRRTGDPGRTEPGRGSFSPHTLASYLAARLPASASRQLPRPNAVRSIRRRRTGIRKGRRRGPRWSQQGLPRDGATRPSPHLLPRPLGAHLDALSQTGSAAAGGYRTALASWLNGSSRGALRRP
jgi:hypothetical protein